MSEIFTVGYLLWCGIWDIRKKYIPIWLIIVGALLSFALFFCEAFLSGKWEWSRAFLGLVPGVCLSIVSIVSAEQVGLGDGLVLLIMGWILGIKVTIAAAILGLFLATCFGVASVIVKKENLQMTMPFIPFLEIGLILTLQII